VCLRDGKLKVYGLLAWAHKKKIVTEAHARPREGHNMGKHCRSMNISKCSNNYPTQTKKPKDFKKKARQMPARKLVQK
jgi:hypothetical protein